MTLDKRHLNFVLVILLLAVAWNIYRFVMPAVQPVQAMQPILANVRPPLRAISQQSRALDPATIPPAPPVAMNPDPAWVRDPFLAPGESRKPRVVVAPVVAGADPTVHSILYSATRKAALVDNRVVVVGDAVSNGVVIDILPDAIVVRTPSGEKRRVAIARMGRPR